MGWRLLRCSVCNGEPPETHSNLPIGFITLPPEPALKTTGRPSDHPFKDLGTTRCVRQRFKKYPERIYSGNKGCRNDGYRLVRPNALRDVSKQADTQEWADNCYDEWAHKLDMDCMDDVDAYELWSLIKIDELISSADGGVIGKMNMWSCKKSKSKGNVRCGVLLVERGELLS
jgi:hypothetical protein